MNTLKDLTFATVLITYLLALRSFRLATGKIFHQGHLQVSLPPKHRGHKCSHTLHVIRLPHRLDVLALNLSALGNRPIAN